MSAPLHLGDFIRMGQVDFVLAQEGREPVVAFLYDFSDSAETKTHLLCFNVHDDHRRYEWHIGRAKENDIVLPEDWQTVSRQQATILYNQENNAFYIRNDSQQIDTLTVNEQPLPPGSFVEMAQIGETRLGLGNHLFWFMPVPYEPAPRR
jgi:hypothetical protein